MVYIFNQHKSHGMVKKKCQICGREFTPDKYHPYQKVCSNPSCQHQRQLLNQKRWREKNPDYFKYKEKKTAWERQRAQYLKIWRETHKEYFKKYRFRRKSLKEKQKLGIFS